MSDADTMTQQAPFPHELADLVNKLEYRPGWRFHLDHIDREQGSIGLTFQVFGKFPNSYRPDEIMNVVHYFPVPPAAFNRQSWQRWLLDRLLELERHECCEFFQIDGERPYAPHHGPGNDPYIIFDHGSDEDARTSFRGDVKPPPVEDLLNDELEAVLRNNVEKFPLAGKIEVPAALDELTSRSIAGDMAARAVLSDLKHRDLEITRQQREAAQNAS